MPPSLPRPPAPAAGPRSSIASWHVRWLRLSPLARDIVLVLIVKAIVLALLWFAFFRAPVVRDMAMDPQRVEHKIIAPQPVSERAHAVR